MPAGACESPVVLSPVAFSFIAVPPLITHFPRYAHKLIRFSTVSAAWPWYLLHCSNYVIASNNGFRHGILDVSWSLAIEEQYYLVWALCVYFLRPKAIAWVCSLTILLSPFLRMAALGFGLSPLQIYVLTPTLDGLMWGSLIAVAIRSSESWRKHLDTILKPIAFVCTAAVFAIVMTGNWNYLGKWEIIAGYSTVSLICAALLWNGYQNPGRLRRFFEQKWLRFFGTYSYSIYLFHLPIRALIRDTVFGERQFRMLGSSAVPGQIIFYLVATAAVIPISLLSWHALEQPFLKLGSRFRPSEDESARPVRYGQQLTVQPQL